jgi:hypothetical protein
MLGFDQGRARRCFALVVVLLVWFDRDVLGQEELASKFTTIQPLLTKYCVECHGDQTAEADIDLTHDKSLTDLRRRLDVWQRVYDVVQSSQMPPVDASQPQDAERESIKAFLHQFLSLEAKRLAGDPGPVVLRRLNNAEYTNSIQALTGLNSLHPAKEFPVDGAAGEGFTNAGNALAMSPALVTKYLDAAKNVSQHVVLLPDGIRFSPSTSRRDWTEEVLAEIRSLYAKYSAKEGGTQVNLQGIVFDTNDGGRLPIASYLQALIEERDSLAHQRKSITQVALDRHLSPKYLQQLADQLKNPKGQLLREIALQVQTATPNDVNKIVQTIATWQRALWKLSSVGHIGKVNGPSAWMEPINPIVTRQEYRLRMPEPSATPVGSNDEVVTLYLTSHDAGDGDEGDEAVWERPRFVSADRPDLLLRDCARIAADLQAANLRLLEQCPKALDAADWMHQHPGSMTAKELAAKYACDEDVVEAWLQYLGMGVGESFQIQGHLKEQLKSASGYDFVQGWIGPDALSIIANSSDTHVRVPGNLAPHSVAVHPSPTVQVVVGWKSPPQATIRIKGSIQHAHPECGNGVMWTLQLRRGATIQNLANGVAHGSTVVPIEVAQPIALTQQDVICLVVAPRDGNHSCDLSAIQMELEESLPPDSNATQKPRRWDLASDLSSNILAGNPHADSLGNQGVWHVFGEPTTGPTGPVIPSGSLLARWQAATSTADRQSLALQLKQVISQPNTDPNAISEADRKLVSQLRSLSSPLMAKHLIRAVNSADDVKTSQQAFGLSASQFGIQSDGRPGEEGSLYVKGKQQIEVRLPASLIAGTEFVTAARLAVSEASLGSVQMQVTDKPTQATGLVAGTPESRANAGAWTASGTRVSSTDPVIVSQALTKRKIVEESFDEFRRLFPAALCYSKIVPVDEVVTLTLFYREDDALQRLMLSEEEIAKLDRLWTELHTISRDALSLVDAFEQIWQYATQDADPSAFEPLRKPIFDRAAAFRQKLIDSQPSHLDAVVTFCSQAYRRPLRDDEEKDLRKLYQTMREAEVDHELAIQSLLTRILVSPKFLYRGESGAGEIQSLADGEIHVRRLSDHEIATRLAYFLTASPPDEELRRCAAEGTLHRRDVLIAQADRLLQSSGVRHLATEFGCQWLHVYDFASHDEKSEQAFPSFASLRDSMYEESIRFWIDLFRRDLPVLELLQANHTFVNEPLAKHYGWSWDELRPNGIDDGQGWMRVDNSQSADRGGILTMASVLSKQSGASRTSPILRGNWLSEVVLGEKLPRPPKNVPVLPDTTPEGLTERQLIEKHSFDPACAKCHARIDPFGFAMEGFDAIGRRRDQALHDTKTRLMDGTAIEGWQGLRDYLAVQRKQDFLKQFCRKLLGFALGRAVQLSDQPLIDDMMNQLANHDHHVRQAIHAVIQSPQFQTVRVDLSPKTGAE